jgi:hypothetical protein
MIPIVGRQYRIVKSLYGRGRGRIEWIKSMDEYVGRTCTVVFVRNDDDTFDKWARIDIDHKIWCWDFNSFKELDMFSDKDFLI